MPTVAYPSHELALKLGANVINAQIQGWLRNKLHLKRELMEQPSATAHTLPLHTSIARTESPQLPCIKFIIKST